MKSRVPGRRLGISRRRVETSLGRTAVCHVRTARRDAGPRAEAAVRGRNVRAVSRAAIVPSPVAPRCAVLARAPGFCLRNRCLRKQRHRGRRHRWRRMGRGLCVPAGRPSKPALQETRGWRMEDITERAGVGVLDDTTARFIRGSPQHRPAGSGGSAPPIAPLLFLNQGDGPFEHKPDAFRFGRRRKGPLREWLPPTTISTAGWTFISARIFISRARTNIATRSRTSIPGTALLTSCSTTSSRLTGMASSRTSPPLRA